MATWKPTPHMYDMSDDQLAYEAGVVIRRILENRWKYETARNYMIGLLNTARDRRDI